MTTDATVLLSPSVVIRLNEAEARCLSNISGYGMQEILRKYVSPAVADEEAKVELFKGLRRELDLFVHRTDKARQAVHEAFMEKRETL
jgi:hypothetical protein